jgi:hypothetical protein
LQPRLGKMRGFTVGIDEAVNAGFLRRLAEVSGGACELIEGEERLDAAMDRLHRMIDTPVLMEVQIDVSGDASLEAGSVVPARLPGLFSGQPLIVSGRFRGRPQGSVRVRAAHPDGQPFVLEVPMSAGDPEALGAVWARGQIRALEDRYALRAENLQALEQQILSTSLKFGVLSRFTAYVAVDRAEKIVQDQPLHKVTQAVEQPHGWQGSAQSIPAPPPAASAPMPQGMPLGASMPGAPMPASPMPAMSRARAITASAPMPAPAPSYKAADMGYMEDEQDDYMSASEGMAAPELEYDEELAMPEPEPVMSREEAPARSPSEPNYVSGPKALHEHERGVPVQLDDEDRKRRRTAPQKKAEAPKGRGGFFGGLIDKAKELISPPAEAKLAPKPAPAASSGDLMALIRALYLALTGRELAALGRAPGYDVTIKPEDGVSNAAAVESLLGAALVGGFPSADSLLVALWALVGEQAAAHAHRSHEEQARAIAAQLKGSAPASGEDDGGFWR